ncbi:c-type cytochrome [Chryseobacterium sp. TY3]
MKKYLYTSVFALTLVYSCASQNGANSQGSSYGVTNEQMATAETLYDARCGKCHDLPATTDHTASEWKPIIERMAPKAKLTAEEATWLLAYVSANAKT